MSRTDLIKDPLAQAYADVAAKASLHTGDPGSTGANDSGITHQSLTWPDPPDGGVIVSDSVNFSVPSSTELTHVGLWDSSDQFLDSFVNNISFGDATTYTLAISYTQE